MQYATQQYREEMRSPYRGHSSVDIYMGLINSDAQTSAKITSSFSGDESQLYDNATSTYSGVTSTENDGSITFTFGDYYEINLAGLTLTFNTIPSSIVVTNGTKEDTFVINGAEEFSFDEGFDNCHYIKITPSSGKLSLKSILFGIGLHFTDRMIMSTNRNTVVDHISNDLPTNTFSFTVNNRSHMFNKDNPYGYANYLQEKQEVVYEYGRELSDGSIYKIKGGKVLLKNWSSDDYNATFSCVGYLDYLEGEYYKGKYYENGISAYDLLEDVFEDAGITNYVLDDSLKKIAIYNPIPKIEYREAIKMIANASRCTLFEDRDGNICIKNANTPSFIVETTFVGATDYSIPTAIFDDNSMYNYADAEREYTHADGTQIFLPDNDNFRQVGFVSSEIANENGLFTNNPHIELRFTSEYQLKALYLNFAVVVPTSITIISKLSGTTVDTQTITPSLVTVYSYEGAIDYIEIRFNSAEPSQRIHLNNIQLNGSIDYELTYHELKETPVASSLEKVSKITVHAYTFNVEKTEEGSSRNSFVKVETKENEDGGDTVDITTGNSEYGSAISTVHLEEGNNTVTFNSPYYNYKITAGEIVESGVYYIVVHSDIEQDADVYANPYSISDNLYTENIHEKGVEKKSENILISTKDMAMQQAKWLKDFYDDDLEYTLIYRGDPILDADDLIYLENHFVSNNEIRITDESINTSTGMNFNCKILARRTSYMTDATLDSFIVGRARIGETL